MIKRIFDFWVSLTAIILLSPIIAIVVILIRIRLGKPVIFRHQRPGKNAKPFYLYKFRTMTMERDQDNNLLPDHLRITSLGRILRKYSLDELPQLFNVLKGDLSLVGPRPLLMQYLPLYNDEQKRRHEVKPGITGWAQINGRNSISWPEKFKLDIWYVDHCSFWLDMKILWLTFDRVLRAKWISSLGDANIAPFTGEEP
jgi:sugar transferase EpsL